MSYMHTVKDNPKNKMKGEVWEYNTGEPTEHTPWLFPQVIGGYRADHISAVSQTISEITTTVVDEEVIEDRPESVSTQQIMIPVSAETQTESTPTPEPVEQEVRQRQQHYFIPPQEQPVEPLTSESTPTPEPIETLHHPSSSPELESETVKVSEEIFMEPLGENESPHDSVSESEYISEPMTETDTEPRSPSPAPTPEPIQKSTQTHPVDWTEFAQEGNTHLDREPARKESVAHKATQTDRFPAFVETKILSYVIYYHQHSKPDKPVAVLLGQIMGQTTSGCEEAKHLNIPHTEGELVMALLDTSDIQMMKDSAYVQHSDDIIKICPQDKAKACVYGQTGAGFMVGSDTVLIVCGILLIANKGNTTPRKLAPGRHLIEPTSGTTKFIICDNKVCILIHTDGAYRVDNESYLDGKRAIRDKPRTKYFTRPLETIVEDNDIHSDSPHESVSESISETISETDTDTEPRSPSPATPTPEPIEPDSESKPDVKYKPTHTHTRADISTQTETEPVILETKVFSYVLYYHEHSHHEKHSRSDKAVAVLFGKVLGQTKTGFDTKHLNIPHTEGRLVMALLDNYDIPLMRDSALVQHSKDMVKICPYGEAKACIYGQTGCGFIIDCESILLISGSLMIVQNDSNKTLSAGRHLVEPSSGLTKFIVCSNGLTILVETDGTYQIDDESYLDKKE